MLQSDGGAKFGIGIVQVDLRRKCNVCSASAKYDVAGRRIGKARHDGVWNRIATVRHGGAFQGGGTEKHVEKYEPKGE